MRFLILFGKLLGFGKIFYFEPLGFAKFDLVLHIKNCFGPSFAHMHMNRSMVIAVKCKAKPLLFKNKRQRPLVNPTPKKRNVFLSKF